MDTFNDICQSFTLANVSKMVDEIVKDRPRGANHGGKNSIQSLMVTCCLQGINPYTYLVDVLQRVGLHPASQVEELTPRVWKTKFADNFLTLDLAL